MKDLGACFELKPDIGPFTHGSFHPYFIPSFVGTQLALIGGVNGKLVSTVLT